MRKSLFFSGLLVAVALFVGYALVTADAPEQTAAAALRSPALTKAPTIEMEQAQAAALAQKMHIEELRQRIDELKDVGRYDAALWDEYYGLTSPKQPVTGHLDQGGDNCSSPTMIFGLPYDAMGTTVGYANDYDSGVIFHCPYAGSIAPDVLYMYTPPMDMYINIDLCHDDTDYDTKLYVYENGCGDQAYIVACDDDGCPDYKSQILNLYVTGGSTYYIVVDGYGTASGDYRMTVTETLPPVPGNDCSDPIVVTIPDDLPYVDAGQTTCERINDYDMTCLGYYDGGEDIIYELTVTMGIVVDILLDPLGIAWTGICIDNVCPPGDPCMYSSTSSSGDPHGLYGVPLEPGTYYIMVDTWPSPDCIPAFDLTITEACVVECPPDGIPEGEPICYDGYEDQFNSGCGGDPVVFSYIDCGEIICGTSGTFMYEGANYRDTDWYELVLPEASTVTCSAVGEFPVLLMLIDAQSGDCIDYIILGFDEAPPCSPATLVFECLPPGLYWLWIAPSVFEGVPCGAAYTATVSCEPCVEPEPCFAAGYEDEYRLGPVFVGDMSMADVPVVNISGQTLTDVTAQVDAPFLVLPDPGPFTVADGETLWVPVQFTPTAPGYVDCAITFFAPGCEPFTGDLTVRGEPLPNTPGAPLLSLGRSCGRVALQVDRNENWATVDYLIAATTDNWVTELYVQLDGTLGETPVWATVSTWHNLMAEDISGLTSGQTLQVKVKAQRLGYTTPYGPETSWVVPPCLEPATPDCLVIQRSGDDVLMNWHEVSFDESGMFPVVDAEYLVQASDSPDGPFSTIDTTIAPMALLSGECADYTRRFYRVVAQSEIGPLAPSLRLTVPDPGEVLTGPFIMAALDAGGGALIEGVDAVFQAKAEGVWSDVIERQMPQWIGGSGIWSAMVDPSELPSGPCSLRVVETGPFGTRIAAHEVTINRPPVPEVALSFYPGVAVLDATASSDPDGTIEEFCWTLPDGIHLYGPVVEVPTSPGDTSIVTFETNDDYGVTTSILTGYMCDLLECIPLYGLWCGCSKMEVNDDKKIKGKNKKFPASHAKDDGDATTTDDDQLLGPNSKPAPQPPKDGDKARAAFNFEVRAEVFYLPAITWWLCTHEQKFQLDEKCNGAQINTNDWYGQPDWDDHPVGGGTWADDNYDDESANNSIQQHTFNKNGKGEFDWLDAPMRGIRVGTLKKCAPGGLTYECLFCAVVDGPLGCCRCKFKVTWSMGPNGQITGAPALDKTSPGLGCIAGAQGTCGC
jgi:hypothetical protein